MPKIDKPSPEDIPLSDEARKGLDAGLASAKRGEIQPMGSFKDYLKEDEERDETRKWGSDEGVENTRIGKVSFRRSGLWWAVEHKGFPGAFSQGESKNDAYLNLLDAMAALISVESARVVDEEDRVDIEDAMEALKEFQESGMKSIPLEELREKLGLK